MCREVRATGNGNHAGGSTCYGIGISQNTVTASLVAIVSAVNRRWKQ